MKITQSEPVETEKSVGLTTFMILSKTLKDFKNKCLENGGGYWRETTPTHASQCI